MDLNSFRSLVKAYKSVHAPQEVEEAIQEADSIAAMRERAAKRRKQRYGASDTSRGGRDDFRPYTKADYERGEANDPRKKVEEELELDQIIESLIERGHTEKEAYALVAQFTLDEGIIDAARAGSKRHEDAMKGAGRAIKKARIRTRKLGKALAPAADTAKSAASGVGRAAKATYEAGKKTGEFVKKGAQRHNDMVKAAKKVFSKEELELIAQIMIDEGYDLSDYTWEEFAEICESQQLDEAEKPFPHEKVKAKQVALRTSKDPKALDRRMTMGMAVRRAKEAEKTGGSQRDAGKGWYHAKEDYVNESQEARNNPEKYEREQSKKYAPVRGEKTPMPPRGDKRREDFEKWYAAQRR